MDTGSILIPFRAVARFSAGFQVELQEYVQTQMSGGVGQDDEAGPTAMGDDEEPADLSTAQAKKFLDRVSDKVRSTIRVIAEADDSGFEMAAVRKALRLGEEEDLRGVWGGITKRTRTVLGDEEAYLIWWNELDTDWVGRVSSMTHRSFRKVLGL
jgi:hypothetical protein